MGTCQKPHPLQYSSFLASSSAADTAILESVSNAARFSSHRAFLTAFQAEGEGPQGGDTGDNGISKLTRWRSKHERTQEGYLCAAAGVKDGVAFTGCGEMPDPSGGEGRRWCYIEPDQAKVAGKSWGYCRKWSGWPDPKPKKTPGPVG